VVNFNGKFYIYHWSGDGYVDPINSDLLISVLSANGKAYKDNRSSTLYHHGNFDLLDGVFDSGTPYGLDWANDAKTMKSKQLPNTNQLTL